MSGDGRLGARLLRVSTVALLLGVSGMADGQTRPHADHALGSVTFPISCASDAQAAFNEAVALLHHMTYPQARQAFEGVAALDPTCAMGHWGVAMTLFQPVWPTRPGEADRQRGWSEVQTAKRLGAPTRREELFITAAEAFFLEPQSSDYWLRIRRWEQASEKVFQAFPDDDEAAAFYALSHLATTPSDVVSRTHADRAAEILLRVYRHNPNHPGAMHYLIHANDVPGRERQQLEITRAYEAVAPENPHALHMPTHIYTRIGDWSSVIGGNLRAAEAALAYPAGPNGEFVWDEFPHAIEYLVYAHLQQGADAAATAQFERLRATANLEPTFKTAFHLVSTQARVVLERHDWEGAARLAPREPASLDWDRFAWPEAIAHFTRGLGGVHLGRLAESRTSAQRLDELEAAMRKAGEELFARNIRVLGLELNGWIAQAEDRPARAVALLREASELEATTPKHAVTPGPTIPALELLGDLYAEQERSADALAAYTESLRSYPARFNSLLGSARAARAIGNRTVARTSYRKLLDVAADGSRTEVLKEARDYVTGVP